jgi:hypothetical protein
MHMIVRTVCLINPQTTALAMLAGKNYRKLRSRPAHDS